MINFWTHIYPTLALLQSSETSDPCIPCSVGVSVECGLLPEDLAASAKIRVGHSSKS
jgi:hypothetical protein